MTTRAAAEEGEPYGVFKLNYDISNDVAAKSAGWKTPIVVAVSGAAGQISNHLLFKIASGEVYGADQPIILNLLGSERSKEALEGVAMELEDSLYPLLRQVNIGIDPLKIFKDAEWALLIGAKPRGPGMERSDLLEMNGQIFVEQGKALNEVANKTCKVCVVGNPCNTNALIAMENAPNLDRKNFHALTRLDENRAKCQLALKAGVFYDTVSNVTIWGNHSTTQVPDFVNAKIAGKRGGGGDRRSTTWLEEEFTPSDSDARRRVLIKKWGRSSAASTAVSIADRDQKSLVDADAGGRLVLHRGQLTEREPVRDRGGDRVTRCRAAAKGDGSYEIVRGFGESTTGSASSMKASEEELTKEADCVSHLTGKLGGACELQGAGTDTMLPGEN